MGELAPDAKKAVKEEVKRIVTKWAKILGIANVGVLVSIISYTFFGMPGDVVDRVMPDVDARVNKITDPLESRIAEGLVLQGRIEQVFADLESNAVSYQDQLSGFRADLAMVGDSNISGIAEVIRTVEESGDAEGLLQRLKEMELMIGELGSERTGENLLVTNPRMGSKRAQCPPGSYVSAIAATKGVGGRYGVDGISELTVTCSKLSSG